MAVRLEIENDEISVALAGVSAALGNPLPLYQDFAEYLVKSTTDRFATGRAPDGSVWAPKSSTTIALQGGRKSNRLDTRPLFGPSGALSSTINAESFSDRVEWGSPMVYAAVQHFGAAKGSLGSYSGIDKNGKPFSGSSPWGNIPARPFAGISAEDETNLLDIIAEYLTQAAGDPG